MYDDTLTMNGAPLKARIGGEVINGTLDALNSGIHRHVAGGTSVPPSYDFQQDVFSAHYTEKGLGAVIHATA